MCGTAPTHTYMAIIHRTVPPASEHTRAGYHPRNIAITLVFDVRRAGGASPPAKGGGGQGGSHLDTPKMLDCWRDMLGLLLCNVHEIAGLDMIKPSTMSRGVWAVD